MSGRRLFGTDGVRGSAEEIASIARDVGRAVAIAARRGTLGAPCEQPRLVLGRDTRPSGPEVTEALVEGAAEGGAVVDSGGILPTAAVAYLTGARGYDGGVVVSASHNPPSDNGIKLFGAGGWKLDEAAEATIGSLVREAPGDVRPTGPFSEVPDGLDSYIDHLCEVATHQVAKVPAVFDCANGAASAVVPRLLERLGIDALTLNDSLDGSMINEGCGALHPEVVAAAAVQRSAVGITFDGDADRVLISDERGRLVGGDAILALLATRMRHEGSLTGDAMVITVMANEALRRWCADEGIKVVETAVGDRYVLEAMRDRGIALGGEQSGHIICLDRSTTGDGILVALELLDLVASSGRPLSELVPFEPFPQVLINVKTSDRDHIAEHPRVRDAIAAAERSLGDDGRVLVRPSGTEPLVRVMVEALDAQRATSTAQEIAAVIEGEA
jgi:phosphoglucosamine mutase